uniref:rhomboid protease n=1 Tax=Timema tahoe TaxID=61484 RepID=A0A7R9II40_9NEOP|nr:unnamed protein product [Timema tahoe]
MSSLRRFVCLAVHDTCMCTTFGRKSLLLVQPAKHNSFRSLRTSASRYSRWPTYKNSKMKPRTDAVETPFENIKIDGGPVGLSNLWKPLGFTIFFSSASFAGAAIWQYENMRAKAIALVKKPVGWMDGRIHRVKKWGKWRQEMNSWWNGLTEGQRIFFPLCFANLLVFVAWRIPRLQGTMVRYFCSNPASRTLCWPMFLSTFSHYSAFHLFANMYVLHSFSSGAVAALSKEQFLALYLSAGVISSFSSYLFKVVTSQPGLSLGASGAIMAVLAYVCTKFPDTKLSIIFLPFFTFPAGTAIKVIMGLDAAGILLRWKFFDHAAHLGGAAFGIAWCNWGNTYIWQKREPLLHWWHELRGGRIN